MVGMNQSAKTGTDVLLDLLSIGDGPAQNRSPASDIFAPSQDKKFPAATLDVLALDQTLPGSASSPAAASILDLLGGFDANPPVPGNIYLIETSLLNFTFLVFDLVMIEQSI